MNRCFRLAVLILIGAEEIAPVTGIASTMDTTMSTETDTLDPVRALAKLIVGPRLPVPIGSQFSLDELRDVRWTSHATSQEKREALSLARAILAAGYRPPSSQPAGAEVVGDDVSFWIEIAGQAIDALDECAGDDAEDWDRRQHAEDASSRVRALYKDWRPSAFATALSATAPADGSEAKSSLLGEAGPGGGAATPSIPGPAACAPADVRRWRHKKTGGVYIEIGRGHLQWLVAGDMEPVVIYRSEADGSLWCRPTLDFEDGRFEALPQGQDGRRVIAEQSHD